MFSKKSNDLDGDSQSKCGVQLRDLQALLQKNEGEKLELVSFRTQSLLTQGFASTMLKVTATVKRTENSQPENLELVAKMTATSDFQKSHFNDTISFKKEIFIYEHLIPMYREIQRKAALRNSELVNFVPKWFGGRLSLNPNSQEADGDVVILMENLQVQGYRTMDKNIGVDLPHAQLTLKTLATYHALGVVCIKRYPEFVKTARLTLDACMVKKIEDYLAMNEKIREDLSLHPKFSIYKDRMKKCFELDVEAWAKLNSANEWLTFVHGDFWVNNVLYHHNVDGHPDAIKMLDFQLSQLKSCLYDLLYFLFNSCRKEILQNNLEEMLATYHNSFIDTLKSLKFDTSFYTKKHFDEELKARAVYVFDPIALSLRFITLEDEEAFNPDDTMNIILGGKVSDNFLERIFVAIEKFADKDWI